MVYSRYACAKEAAAERDGCGPYYLRIVNRPTTLPNEACGSRSMVGKNALLIDRKSENVTSKDVSGRLGETTQWRNLKG
jgi:hypothetical protein